MLRRTLVEHGPASPPVAPAHKAARIGPDKAKVRSWSARRRCRYREYVKCTVARPDGIGPVGGWIAYSKEGRTSHVNRKK
jgi:hypothetical protein